MKFNNRKLNPNSLYKIFYYNEKINKYVLLKLINIIFTEIFRTNLNNKPRI